MILPLSNSLDSFKYTLNIYNVQVTGINKRTKISALVELLLCWQMDSEQVRKSIICGEKPVSLAKKKQSSLWLPFQPCLRLIPTFHLMPLGYRSVYSSPTNHLHFSKLSFMLFSLLGKISPFFFKTQISQCLSNTNSYGHKLPSLHTHLLRFSVHNYLNHYTIYNIIQKYTCTSIFPTRL